MKTWDSWFWACQLREVSPVIDKQVTPRHNQGVLTLITDGWPGRGSWEMEFGCQDLQSSTEVAEVAKVASTGPHRNACMVRAVCFRQSGEASSAA